MSRPVPSPEIIVSGNLTLKFLKLESAGIIFESIDLNRKYLRKWLPFVDNTWKEEDTENFIQTNLRSSVPKPDIVYEIWYTGSFAGLIASEALIYFRPK